MGILLRKAKDSYTSVDHNKRDVKSTKPSHTPKERSYISHSRVFPDDAILVEAYFEGKPGQKESHDVATDPMCLQSVWSIYINIIYLVSDHTRGLTHIWLTESKTHPHFRYDVRTLIPLELAEFARFPSERDVPMPSHIKGSCRNVLQSCCGCSHQGPGTSDFLPAKKSGKRSDSQVQNRSFSMEFGQKLALKSSRYFIIQ